MNPSMKKILVYILCAVVLLSCVIACVLTLRKNDPTPSGSTAQSTTEEALDNTTENTTPDTVYHVVSFDCAGGTAVAAQSIEHGYPVTQPENPAKEGFSFIEWQYQGAAYDFSTPVTQSITLTAVYKANKGIQTVTITLDYQNGDSPISFEIKKGTLLSMPLQPHKQGYTFSGWQLGDTAFDFSTPVQKDITLTATWTPIPTSPNEDDTPDEPAKPVTPSKPAAPQTIHVSGVSLNTDKLSLAPGDTKTLHAIITPENAEDQTVKWTSTDPAVASVSEDGKVTAHKVGAATIIVTTNDGDHGAACLVAVTTDPLTASAKHQVIISTGIDGSVRQGFDLDITANGGTESYTYNVKIFRNGVLEATKRDAFIKYYITSGSYRVEITVTDSGGNKVILDPIQIS